jgi:hypothetical protein
VNILEKGIKNANSSNFISAIRMVNEIKKRSVYKKKPVKSTNYIGLFFDRIIPQIVLKIFKKLEEMHSEYTIYLKTKQKELGSSLLTLLWEKLRQNQMNSALPLPKQSLFMKDRGSIFLTNEQRPSVRHADRALSSYLDRLSKACSTTKK